MCQMFKCEFRFTSEYRTFIPLQREPCNFHTTLHKEHRPIFKVTDTYSGLFIDEDGERVFSDVYFQRYSPAGRTSGYFVIEPRS